MAHGHRIQDGMHGVSVVVGKPMVLGRRVPKLLYLSPTRNYPLGFVVPQTRRESVLTFARNARAWVVEDDYDAEFRFAGPDLPSLRSSDPERVLYMNTFSKTLVPSLRLGYIVVPPALVDAFERARSALDRPAPALEQLVLAEFLERGLFAAHLRRMRTLYHARQIRLSSRLAPLQRFGISVELPQVGTHIVLRYPGSQSDRDLARKLERTGLVTRPLSAYYAGTAVSSAILLGSAGFDDAEIDEKAALLVQALPAML